MAKRPEMPVVLLTHPFELALGALLVVNAIRFLAFSEVTPSLDALPLAPRLLYLTVSALGGIAVVTGLFLNDRAGKRYERAALGIALERAALFLVAASYAGLGILIVGVNGRAGIGTALVTTVVAAACILRTVAIRRSVQAVTRALKRARQEDGGSHG